MKTVKGGTHCETKAFDGRCFGENYNPFKKISWKHFCIPIATKEFFIS